ncbi:sulfatase-like hydrolase/transferase [Haloferax denitrificans]|uniref:sulfatase-like hydrolase/transferase n=1 Tax=Haloferax denitrificans TaxID=35745 RepID=UPI003C6FA9FE
MSESTPLSVRLATSIVQKVPNSVENAVSPIYYYYNSRKADTEHKSPSIKATRRENSPDHILLLVVDALRPDAVPNVGLDFAHAITPATWTYPAMTSIHTSLYPHEHGSIARTHPDDDEFAMPTQYDEQDTLSHVLEAAGYSTYSGCSFIVPFLATRGWYQTNRVYGDERAKKIISDYRQWRSGRDQTYGYLHLGDLHNPLKPPQEYINKHNVDESLDLEFPDQWASCYDGSEQAEIFRDERLKLYRAALEYVSDEIEILLDEISNDTLIVITGDHGECQFEHSDLDQQFSDSRPNYGVGHGGTPFDELARVPVSVSHPEGGSINPLGGRASLIDVPRTICEQVVQSNSFNGFDWVDPIPKERAAICEASRYGTERKAVYKREVMAIHSKSDDVTLFATVDNSVTFVDGLEEDLIAELPDQWDDFSVETNSGEFAKSQLKALGYV